MIRQGDIYRLPMAEPEGSEPGYTHPVVVIQNDAFNMSGIKTTAVCVITSNIRFAKSPGNVALKKGAGGLVKSTVVNVSQIFTVDKRFLQEAIFIGRLPMGIVNKIVDGIKLLIEPREI